MMNVQLPFYPENKNSDKFNAFHASEKARAATMQQLLDNLDVWYQLFREGVIAKKDSDTFDEIISEIKWGWNDFLNPLAKNRLEMLRREEYTRSRMIDHTQTQFNRARRMVVAAISFFQQEMLSCGLI